MIMSEVDIPSVRIVSLNLPTFLTCIKMVSYTRNTKVSSSVMKIPPPLTHKFIDILSSSAGVCIPVDDIRFKEGFFSFHIICTLTSITNNHFTETISRLTRKRDMFLRKGIMGNVVNPVVIKKLLVDHPRCIGNDFIHPPVH